MRLQSNFHKHRRGSHPSVLVREALQAHRKGGAGVKKDEDEEQVEEHGD
jgi:hypothetical protein